MIWLHPGAGDLSAITAETAEGLRALSSMLGREGCDLYITHLQGGIHSDGSFHPFGRAADIRRPAIDKEEIWAALRKMGFDVVDEGSHIHIEYDPKPRRAHG